MVEFIDSNSLKEIETQEKVQTECEYVFCVNFREENPGNKDTTGKPVVLFMGGFNSNKITKSVLPKEVTQKCGILTRKMIKSKDEQIEELTRENTQLKNKLKKYCLLYTSPSPRDLSTSRMPSSA